MAGHEAWGYQGVGIMPADAKMRDVLQDLTTTVDGNSLNLEWRTNMNKLWDKHEQRLYKQEKGQRLNERDAWHQAGDAVPQWHASYVNISIDEVGMC